jgi:hypothetical protein
MLIAYSGKGRDLVQVLVVVCGIILEATNQKRNYEMLDKKLPNEVHCFAYQGPYCCIVQKHIVAYSNVLFCIIWNHIIAY